VVRGVGNLTSAFGLLVSGLWLAEHLKEPDLRVIDFRWDYDHQTGEGRSARPAYEAAHIPGAAFVDLEAEVTGQQPGQGRHPLPTPEAFQQAMRTAGIARESRVVVYDDHGAFSAARLWWLLQYFGHDATAVLDGGLQAWPGPLTSGIEEIPEGDFVAVPRPDLRLDYDQVRHLADGVLLLDARRLERYLGDAEPIEVRSGHIPGARSAYWRDNLTPEGRFKNPEELRRRFIQAGAQEGRHVVAYCGSGISACHDLLALEVAGLGRGRLYPGSWSDWSSRPDAPIATGEDPAA
jgi:thiosulfate/3-mercaptopyruvate sulfurtransferase